MKISHDFYRRWSTIGILMLMLWPMIGCRQEREYALTSCFPSRDTISRQETRSCRSGWYKLLNDRYKLSIMPDLNVAEGECRAIVLDSTDFPFATLTVYKKGEANLWNECTDEVIRNAPTPTKYLTKCYGKLIIGKHYQPHPRRPYNAGSIISIYVDTLTFIDPETHEEIIIQDELLWKMHKLGKIP